MVKLYSLKRNSSAIVPEGAFAFGAYRDSILNNTWYSTGEKTNYLFVHDVHDITNNRLSVYVAYDVPTGEIISDIAPWEIPTGGETNSWVKSYSINSDGIFTEELAAVTTPYIVTKDDHDKILLRTSATDYAFKLDAPGFILPIKFRCRIMHDGGEDAIFKIYNTIHGLNEPSGGWSPWNDTTPPAKVPAITTWKMAELVKINTANWWVSENVISITP